MGGLLVQAAPRGLQRAGEGAHSADPPPRRVVFCAVWGRERCVPRGQTAACLALRLPRASPPPRSWTQGWGGELIKGSPAHSPTVSPCFVPGPKVTAGEPLGWLLGWQGGPQPQEPRRMASESWELAVGGQEFNP